MEQYFSGPALVYDKKSFERRFGAPRQVVERLIQAVMGCDPLIQKVDLFTKRPGIRPLVRFAACMNMLVYENYDDRFDEHLQILESSMNKSLKHFCRLIVAKFPEYLNICPKGEEKEQALVIMAETGFPGCFGSWDCQLYFWSNCLVDMAGQCKEKGGKTLVMEAMMDPHLYILYYNFGSPGSMSDINILDRINIVGALLSGKFDGKVTPCCVNGTQRDWLYFLVDWIYPPWGIFAKFYQSPTLPSEILYKISQEHARKDIERAFRVLVSHCVILERKLCGCYVEDLKDVISTCIIMHNMTIEVRRENFQFSGLKDIPPEEFGEGGGTRTTFPAGCRKPSGGIDGKYFSTTSATYDGGYGRRE